MPRTGWPSTVTATSTSWTPLTTASRNLPLSNGTGVGRFGHGHAGVLDLLTHSANRNAKEVGILQDDTEADCLSGQCLECRVIFPGGGLLDGIPVDLRRIGLEKPGTGRPSASWISSTMLPAPEVEKFSKDRRPANRSGLVTSSPPASGAWSETNPSIRKEYRRRTPPVSCSVRSVT